MAHGWRMFLKPGIWLVGCLSNSVTDEQLGFGTWRWPVGPPRSNLGDWPKNGSKNVGISFTKMMNNADEKWTKGPLKSLASIAIGWNIPGYRDWIDDAFSAGQTFLNQNYATCNYTFKQRYAYKYKYKYIYIYIHIHIWVNDSNSSTWTKAIWG